MADAEPSPQPRRGAPAWRRPLRIGLLVLGIPGGLVAVLALLLAGQSVRDEWRTLAVAGEIVGLQEMPGDSGSGFPILRFRTPDGTVHQSVGQLAHDRSTLPVSGPVVVRYDPGEPDKGHPAWFFDRWGFALLMLAAAAILLAPIGAWWLSRPSSGPVERFRLRPGEHLLGRRSVWFRTPETGRKLCSFWVTDQRLVLGRASMLRDLSLGVLALIVSITLYSRYGAAVFFAVLALTLLVATLSHIRHWLPGPPIERQRSGAQVSGIAVERNSGLRWLLIDSVIVSFVPDETWLLQPAERGRHNPRSLAELARRGQAEGQQRRA